MTDRDLALALTEAQALEARTRQYWQSVNANDLPERDAALVVVRKTAELVRMLERWMTARATRAALQHS